MPTFDSGRLFIEFSQLYSLRFSRATPEPIASLPEITDKYRLLIGRGRMSLIRLPTTPFDAYAYGQILNTKAAFTAEG